jgi:sugar lactone lactonase YvrE
MTLLPDGSYLAADSVAATLWRLDPNNKSGFAWVQHELLAPDPAANGFALGANGLKVVGRDLLISNTSRGALYKLSLVGSAPLGVPNLFAKTGSIDDFIVARDGTIYATTHADAILRISPQGEVSSVVDVGGDGCTAVFLDPADTTERAAVLPRS